jgi:hypothetical protein
VSGWTDAANGKRYATIDTRKTQSNMGQSVRLYMENALDIEEMWQWLENIPRSNGTCAILDQQIHPTNPARGKFGN